MQGVINGNEEFRRYPLIWFITEASIIPKSIVLTAGCFTAAQTVCGPYRDVALVATLGFCNMSYALLWMTDLYSTLVPTGS